MAEILTTLQFELGTQKILILAFAYCLGFVKRLANKKQIKST